MDPFVKLARVPNRPPRVDILVAGGLLAWALLEAFVDRGPGPLAGRIAFAVAISVPLAFRRQAPGLVVLVLSVATLAWALPTTVPEHGTMPFPSVLLAAFSVACYARRTVVAPGEGGVHHLGQRREGGVVAVVEGEVGRRIADLVAEQGIVPV